MAETVTTAAAAPVAREAAPAAVCGAEYFTKVGVRYRWYCCTTISTWYCGIHHVVLQLSMWSQLTCSRACSAFPFC